MFKVLWVHLFLSLGSDVFLLLTAMTSLGYLFQEHSLKSKKQLVSLPSIQALDTWSLRFLITAFVMMTGGIIAGSCMAYMAWGDYWYLDPRELWSSANWVLFAVVLLARFLVGWRGRLAVLTTLCGVSFVLIGFFVIHYFSWSQHVGF